MIRIGIGIGIVRSHVRTPYKTRALGAYNLPLTSRLEDLFLLHLENEALGKCSAHVSHQEGGNGRESVVPVQRKSLDNAKFTWEPSSRIPADDASAMVKKVLRRIRPATAVTQSVVETGEKWLRATLSCI